MGFVLKAICFSKNKHLILKKSIFPDTKLFSYPIFNIEVV